MAAQPIHCLRKLQGLCPGHFRSLFHAVLQAALYRLYFVPEAISPVRLAKNLFFPVKGKDAFALSHLIFHVFQHKIS
jgi:hypothetical protein